MGLAFLLLNSHIRHFLRINFHFAFRNPRLSLKIAIDPASPYLERKMKSLVLMAISLVASVSMATQTQAIFTLKRVNYKPEKLLHYDLVFDAAKCAIDANNPFDVYYVDINTNERLTEFSSNSQQYFSPRLNEANLTKTTAELNFKALDEIRKISGSDQKIIASLYKDNSGCHAKAEIIGAGTSSVLEQIEIKMKLKFGLPMGVAWVLIHELVNNQPVDRCLTDKCE